jgi:hypothetical protein
MPVPSCTKAASVVITGMREGEEGAADVEDVVEVTVVEEEDDDESIEVIPVPDSPPT